MFFMRLPWVSQIDLFASLSGLIDGTIPTDAAPDSRNQLDTWLGNDTKGRDYIVEHAGAMSVYDGTWKYIAPSNGRKYSSLTNTEMGNDTVPQLYNLKLDINEQNNVAPEHEDEVERLRNILENETISK